MSHRHRRTPGIVRFVCIDSWHDDRPHRVTVMRLTEDGLVQYGKKAEEHQRPDGGITYRFRCGCGRDEQRDRDVLGRKAAELFASNPQATRIDVEICTLRGAAS